MRPAKPRRTSTSFPRSTSIAIGRASIRRGSTEWDQNANPGGCSNEDINRNGVLESVEDINHSAAIEPRKSDVAVTIIGTGKTDDSGMAVVQIEYPQNVATWTRVNILVSATGVSGTEGRATWTEVLSAPAAAFTQTSAPAFIASPYGQVYFAEDPTNPPVDSPRTARSPMERPSPPASSSPIPAGIRSDEAFRIGLIGMPGSGKSTIGKAASARLGLAYVDVDQEIEQQSGCSVRAFFERHGEQAFRDLETEVLRSLLVGPPCLIATGGGVVLREENRQALRSRALCVFLEASPRLLWSRLRRDRRRPLLQFNDAERACAG